MGCVTATSRLLGVIRNYLARSLGSRGSLRENMQNSQNPRGFLDIFNFHRFFVVLVTFVGFWMVSGTMWDTLRRFLPWRLQSRVSGARIVVENPQTYLKIYIFHCFRPSAPQAPPEPDLVIMTVNIGSVFSEQFYLKISRETLL